MWVSEAHRFLSGFYVFILRDVELARGFTAKEGRCISKVACQGIADQYVLSGTGNVTRFKGHALGLYTLRSDTGYYEQKGGDYYLMQDRDKGWYTFPHISGCDRKETFSCIAQYTATLKTDTLDGPDWFFGLSKGWSKDETISFNPLTSSSCLKCSTILLTSTGPAKEAKPEYFGTFKMMPFTYSAGRPVYKNDAGKFLMMKNEYTSFSVWDDMERVVRAGKGDDKGTRGMRSVSGPTCVTDLTGQGGWQFSDQKERWVEDKTVTVECADKMD